MTRTLPCAFLASLALAGCYEPRLAAPDGGGPDAAPAASAALAFADASVAFGDVVLGRTSATAQLVVRNRGDADTGRLSLRVEGHADFAVLDDECGGAALPPAGSCAVSVAFAPTAGGARAAELVVDASPGGPARAPLTGRGLLPCELGFDAASHDFGAIAVTAGSPAQTFTLTNHGQAVSEPLAVSLTAGAPFAVTADTCTGATLAGGDSCTIAARFQPTGVGNANGSLTIGAPGGCATAASLGGTGTARVSVTPAGGGTGTVTSSPMGIDCGATCAHDFSTATVTLSAATPAGHTFTGWGGACSAAGTGACTLTLGGATSVTATFETDKILTVGRAGTGAGTVTSAPAGIDCGAQCTAAFPHGAQVVLAAAPAAGSSFAGWTGACAGTAPCMVTMDAARSVGATFELLVQPLSVTVVGSGSVASSPAGIACPGDCAEDYAHGSSVTLSAAPATGWVFNGWSGACTGAGACQIAMTAMRSVTATFVLTTPSLTVSKLGAGSGTVTSSPAGISCGSTCATAFPFGTSVSLTATAAAGSVFTGWAGACSGTGACTVTVDAARSVDATFARIQQPLTVVLAGTGLGVVTSSPAGIDCGTACTASFDEGSTVTLSPAPAAGSQLSGWSGACTGTGACQISMTAAKSVTATFVPAPQLLTVTRTGAGGGTVTANLAGITCGTDCTEAYPIGTVVTLTATPDSASDFAGWSGPCSGVSTCVVTMSQAQTVTASFVLEQNTLDVSTSGDGSGSVTSSPAGINCGATCSAVYNGNQTVTLSAHAASGSTFVGWSGSLCSGTGSCTVSMTQSRSVDAEFVLPHALTVIKDGTGAGTVTSTPSGINCGATCSASLTGTITLTATASAGSGFVKWTGCTGTSGSTCTVDLTADRTVTATFGILRAVTLTKTGSGTGTTSSSPAGLTCSTTCTTVTGSFPDGTTLQVNAAGLSGSVFAGWGGACSGLTSPCTLAINGAKSITAAFEPTRTLTVSKSGNGSGTVVSSPSGISCGSTCTAGFANGSAVTLTATAAAGSHFAGWSTPCSGTSTCTVTMDASKTVTATFASP